MDLTALLNKLWNPKRRRGARVRDIYREYLKHCHDNSKITEQRALAVSPDQKPALLNCFRLQDLLRAQNAIRFEFLLEIHSLDCALFKSLGEIEQRLDEGWTEAEEGVLKEFNPHYSVVSREITEIRSKWLANSLTVPLQALQQDPEYSDAAIAHAALVRKLQRRMARGAPTGANFKKPGIHGRGEERRRKAERLMNHPLQCTCGTLKGYVRDPGRVNRVVCYCSDCRAFAHFLGRAGEILDSKGGTDVIQTVPANVTFTQGQQALACIRLTEKGLVRWYAKCCNTPIGNTLADFRISFIGLIHTCLEDPNRVLDESFGPVRMWSFTKGAKAPVKSRPGAMIAGMLRFIAMLIRARISGDYKLTPFFMPDTGAPVATPKILNQSEREAVFKFV